MAGDPHPVFQDGSPVSKGNARTYLPLRLGNADALRSLDGSTFWLCYIQTLHAFFYRDTSDTTSEDNGSSIIVDGDGNIWKVITSGSGVAIGAAGPLADRDDFDGEEPGFAYFGTDTGLIYVRLTGGGWSSGSSMTPEPGADGPPGPPFDPDEIVPLIADRDPFDAAAKNFGVLIEADSTNLDRPTIYYKLSATSGDWSDGFTYAVRTLVAPAAGFVIIDADGVAGDPTFELANDLEALEAMAGTGLVVRTASETYAQRTLTGTSGEVDVANGSGVSGNPTFTLPGTMTGAKTWNAAQIYKQHITADFKSTGTVPTPISSGSGLQIVGSDGGANIIGIEAFGAGVSIIYGRHADGTNASKTATQSGVNLIQFLGYGYGATGYASASRGKFAIATTENWTDTAQGTQIQLEATIGGSTSRVVSLVARGTSIYVPAAATTASAANAFLDSASSPYANELKRSTSSRRYKKDVETIEPQYSSVIYKLRGVWYRSKCPGDNPYWGYWGLISEETAEHDERLVHWEYRDEDYDVIETVTVCEDEETGEKIRDVLRERVLKPGAKLVPGGVQYERVVPLVVMEMQRHERIIAEQAETIALLIERIDSLTASVSELQRGRA